MKPYYQHKGMTIYHGDCREILPVLGGFELVIADPPYGVAINRGDGKLTGRLVHGDEEMFDPSHLLALERPMVLFGANAYAERLPASTGWLVWDKYHHEKSQHSQAELAWTNFVRGIRVHREAYHGFMRKRDGWFHPTQKPVGLFQWILELHWTPPGAVLDPYMGSGPVLLAAYRCGRSAIGIEIEEHFCEIAAQRLAKSQPLLWEGSSAVGTVARLNQPRLAGLGEEEE